MEKAADLDRSAGGNAKSADKLFCGSSARARSWRSGPFAFPGLETVVRHQVMGASPLGLRPLAAQAAHAALACGV